MANNNNSSTGSGGDFLAFSSQPDQQQAAQRSHNFRPYNHHRNQQYFSPQGSSSPIGGNFRGGDARPRFNDAPENGGGGGGGRRGGGGNRSFGRHRQQFNRRGGHHHNNSRGGSGSFQRIHFQAAGSGEPCNMNDYFHPSMLEDPWAHCVVRARQPMAAANSSDSGAENENDDVDDNDE